MKQNAFKLNENFIKNYDEDIHKGYMLEADVKYPELYKLHNDLTFLPERMKIKKCQKLVSNQKAWLKSYTDINTKLRTEVKNSFEKYFFKLMNNAVFGKTMENVREKGDIKLVTKNKRRNYLVLELNYNTTKWFSENLQAIEVKKIKAKMNKPVYLGLSIPEICKTLIMSFGMIILKPKYAKLYYMYTDSFTIHNEAEDVYKNFANDVEKRFDTSNYSIDRSLPIAKKSN